MNVLYVVTCKASHKIFFRTIESKMASTSLKRSISYWFLPYNLYVLGMLWQRVKQLLF